MKKYLILLIAICGFTVAASAQNANENLVPYRMGDKWGFASPEKKVVIAPKYAAVDWFYEGYAAVKVGAKWGYINKAGKLVIPAKFTVANPFKKGFMPSTTKAGGDSILFAGASLKADGYEICINTRGANLGKCPAISEAAQNKEPIASVSTKKVYSVPNSRGLFDNIEDDYMLNNEQYYIAKKGNRYGIFNTKFDAILPFEYSSVKATKVAGETYLIVEKDGMYGLTDAMGKEIIPAQNAGIMAGVDRSKKGYVIVKNNGRTYVTNMEGKNLLNRNYGDVMYDTQGGFVLTGDNNLKGFYFPDNTYISPRYTSVQLLPGGRYLSVTSFAGKKGYINVKGDEFFVD